MKARLFSKPPSVSVVDYGSGNIRSLISALARAGADVSIASTPEQILAAERIVVPGQGAFSSCIVALNTRSGMLQALNEVTQNHARPYLGVCVGMQLMADIGVEYGTHKGLGWIAGEVIKLQADAPNTPSASLALPHMGWNVVYNSNSQYESHPVFKHIKNKEWFYFAHSYHFVTADIKNCALACDYGEQFVAAISKDSMIGTQFHPEKSQQSGHQLIENFLRWQP